LADGFTSGSKGACFMHSAALISLFLFHAMRDPTQICRQGGIAAALNH
jgi:hypothetical protein